MAAIIYTNNFWRFLLYTKVKRQLGTDLDTRMFKQTGSVTVTKTSSSIREPVKKMCGEGLCLKCILSHFRPCFFDLKKKIENFPRFRPPVGGGGGRL